MGAVNSSLMHCIDFKLHYEKYIISTYLGGGGGGGGGGAGGWGGEVMIHKGLPSDSV